MAEVPIPARHKHPTPSKRGSSARRRTTTNRHYDNDSRETSSDVDTDDLNEDVRLSPYRNHPPHRSARGHASSFSRNNHHKHATATATEDNKPAIDKTSPRPDSAPIPDGEYSENIISFLMQQNAKLKSQLGYATPTANTNTPVAAGRAAGIGISASPDPAVFLSNIRHDRSSALRNSTSNSKSGPNVPTRPRPGVGVGVASGSVEVLPNRPSPAPSPSHARKEVEVLKLTAPLVVSLDTSVRFELNGMK